jgi:hypothetical protein
MKIKKVIIIGKNSHIQKAKNYLSFVKSSRNLTFEDYFELFQGRKIPQYSFF